MRHDALAAASVYVGAVVGAGFATGREVFHFFGAYGPAGLWGCLAAGLAFAWLGGRILRLAATGKAPTYAHLYRLALGPALAPPADWVTTLFLFVGLSVVLAGGAALGADAWGMPPLVGAIAMALAIAVVVLPGRSGVVLGNLTLVPLLAAGAAALLAAEASHPGFWLRVQAAAALPGRSPSAWPLGGLLYVGYNILMGAVALCAVGGELPVRPAVRGGLAGGAALGLLAALVTVTLLAHGPEVRDAAVPLARVVAPYPAIWRFAYSACLVAALITTGVASAYALAARLDLHRFTPGVAAAGAVVLALPLATVGLVALVATVYPAMGVVGLLLCAGLVLRPLAKD
ncbi:MAG TPA: hypothetical protein VNM16_08415 [Bacillota bacterium]|nr:hypothetical protein [Bacillota bacterium]